MSAKQTKLLPKLILQPIKAGFPNAAEDSPEVPLDLNTLLVKHPASTFYMRVDGDSMQDMSIHTGDLIIVDKSLEIRSGDVVVAFIDGEFTLKQFIKLGNKGILKPANPAYPEIEVGEGNDFQIWGVVTNTIHSHRKA
jgi:DNA polymerase V